MAELENNDDDDNVNESHNLENFPSDVNFDLVNEKEDEKKKL